MYVYVIKRFPKNKIQVQSCQKSCQMQCLKKPTTNCSKTILLKQFQNPLKFTKFKPKLPVTIFLYYQVKIVI